VKIDGNSILRNAQGGADSKRFEGNFKAALLRAGGGRASTATPGPTIRQNSALRLLNDASQVPAPRALAPLLENFVAINAGGAGSDSKTNFWYQVRKGDTLYGIVKSRLKTLDQTATPHAIAQLTRKIAQLNKISNQDRIFPEQKINLANLKIARLTIVDLAPIPASHSMTAPVQDATNHQTFNSRNTTQAEATPVSRSTLDAEPASQDGYASQSAGGQQLANAYLPDHLQDRSNASPATENCIDDVKMNNPSLPSSDINTEREKTNALTGILYKGLVGKALDSLPINPEIKTGLQQINAIVSGPMAGRALAAITGLASPVLAVAGLIWGLFAAKNIGTAAADRQSATADTLPAGNSAANGKYNTPESSSVAEAHAVVWHAGLHKPQGQFLGKCTDGKLLVLPEDSTRAC
jgi:hypothetical protein